MEYVRAIRSRPSLPAGPFLVVGLARSGRAAALALRARGETVIGVDSGDPETIADLVEAGIECELGTDGVAQLDRARTVIKSPGVPSDAAVILKARERGLEVIGELELGWRLVPHRTVAITGTNGKTTTTELTTHIFRQAGLPVEPAGNVGHPLCGLAPGLRSAPHPDGLTVVCECSSFQLEDSTGFAPEVAVLLNLGSDHIDRHGDIETYQRAKLNIFRNQTADDVAVLDTATGLPGGTPGGAARPVRVDSTGTGQVDDAELVLADGRIMVEGEPLLSADDLGVKGSHNVSNAMAAAAAALACGIPADRVAAGLRDFKPVAHRFEPVAEIEAVDFINDSKATNVEATLAALGSFEDGVHLILGGIDKGESFDRLIPAVRRTCRGIYLIGETADRIGETLAPAGIGIVRYCEDLEAAVSEAAGAATPGETVLLSPACASFDQFSSFEHRGDVFRELVAGLRG
ncbi:MAG: UDP-N-acetylmuramoyl-L-alanine--D-glutamate ligase [Solirubrobacterales bacterium]|nr:UDP-N-acetylmuramoyl-L-alanine--D-glutamate ligase [Solirubrobacterales bacterium]